MFYRLTEARARTEAYPVEEVNEYCRYHADRADAVAHTLAYFDPQHHAEKIAAHTLLTVGDAGSIGGPEWLAPLTDALGGSVSHYPLTHEGATDHDYTDAWLAGQLGSTPKPRLWTTTETGG